MPSFITFLLFKDAYLPFYEFFPQYLAIEFFRVEPYSTLLHFLTSVDRASVVVGEDDGAGGTLSGTGWTVVLAVLRMDYCHTVVDHLIHAEGTELETFATFGTRILVERGIPRILTEFRREVR